MMLMDTLRLWQAEGAGGPDLWWRSWDRALELVAPAWRDLDMSVEGPVLADGGAALAMAIYLVAAEHTVEPADVTRDQVEALQDGAAAEVKRRWEDRLRALGHDLDSTDDPVAVRWRSLRTDHSDQPGTPRSWLGDDFDYSFRRWGFAFQEGLRKTLGARFAVTF